MNKYIFYYDESYTCRNVNYKNESINIEINENDAEFYIGCFIGSNQWEEILPAVSQLEKEYKKNQGMNDAKELKSTDLLKRKSLKYGISSLKENTISFYSKLFEILNNKVKIHINVLNKYEQIIINFFPDSIWFEERNYSWQLFIYSFTKFLTNHRNEYDITKILFSNDCNEDKIKKLICIFKEHLNRIKNLNKKTNEIEIINMFLKVLSEKDFCLKDIKKIAWNYDMISTAFKNYIDSTNIEINKITIDNEQNTKEALEKFFGNNTVFEEDSKDNILIRICDWVAGFIGRLILNYSLQIKNNPNEFSEQLSLLENKCFCFCESSKKMILQIYDLFLNQQNEYWATTTSIYSDYTILFYTFIRYCQYCLEEKKNMNPNDFNNFLNYEYDCRYNNSIKHLRDNYEEEILLSYLNDYPNYNSNDYSDIEIQCYIQEYHNSNGALSFRFIDKNNNKKIVFWTSPYDYDSVKFKYKLLKIASDIKNMHENEFYKKEGKNYIIIQGILLEETSKEIIIAAYLSELFYVKTN